MLRLKRISQISASHCGPATLQMLLCRYGYHYSQPQITQAAVAQKTIRRFGCRPDQLAQAVAKLAPDLQFWFKEKTQLSDLKTLVLSHHCPVGLNWQSLFYPTLAEEKRLDRMGDHGHYCLLAGFAPKPLKVCLIDPYRAYAKKTRCFSYRWFASRWYDKAITPNKDQSSGKSIYIYTHRLSFVLTRKSATFPLSLKMDPAHDFSQFFRHSLNF